MNFFEKAKNKYNEQYDYSLVEYINNRTKVKIKCNSCGEVFERNPYSFLQGFACHCKSKNKTFKKTVEQFIEEARQIHGDKYDYSLVEYINNRTKVKIKCNSCGKIFEMQPANHLKGQGCLEYCPTAKKTTEQFIEEAKLIHEDKYDYSLVNYINNYTKVKIKCNNCGLIFEQKPNDHLNGSGCPNCAISKAENKIKNILKENNVFFEEQKTFPDLKDKRKLSYDFYIPSKNLLIEYNGEQHYKSIKHFGGRKRFLLQRHHDWLKRKYAKKNGITLLVIPFWKDLVVEVTNFLCKD